jgi:hypothetical protein
MRNMLAFLAALTLTVAGLGWYLDWYKLRTAPAADGHRSVTVDINSPKIGQDVSQEVQVLRKKFAERGQAADKSGPAADPVTEKARPEKSKPGKAGPAGTEKVSKVPAGAAPSLLPDGNPVFTPFN